MVQYSNTAAADFVARLQSVIGTRDGLAEEFAAKHLADGTPAYGWTCFYHNQRASLFAGTVARLGKVEAAIEELAPFFSRGGKPFDPQPLLAYLLPLNPAAVRDLKMAYENGGQTMTAEALESRTENYRIRAA